MAKRKNGISMLGVFKQYFIDHPEWLQTRNNDAVIAQFAKDHPKIPVEKNVRQAMFNAKNLLRQGGKGTPGRKQKIAEVRAAIAKPKSTSAALQLLESQVDDCLAMARQFGKDQIGDVISHLHRARNILVVKIES